MKDNPFTVTVLDPAAVFREGDYLVINNKKSYKIIHVDGTTITYQLSLWERVLNFLFRRYWQLYWWAVDTYDDIAGKIRERFEQ